VPQGDWIWLEVKEADSRGYMLLPKLFRDWQRQRMGRHESWVFAVLADSPSSRAPNGVSAFLVPWPAWQEMEDKVILELGVKSIRRVATKQLPGAVDLLSRWSLKWQPGAGDVEGFWIIPENFRGEYDAEWI